MQAQPISLHFAIVTDDSGKVTVVPAVEGEDEKVIIDRAAVKSSAKGCVKKTDGEILAKRIRDAMEERDLTVAEVAKAAKISTMSFYTYLRLPGRAPLASLLRMCKAAGIQQLTLMTNGTFIDKGG